MASALSCVLFLLLFRSCAAGEAGGEVYGGPLPDGVPQCWSLEEADAQGCCASGETCVDLLPCPAKAPRKAAAGPSPAEGTSRNWLSIGGVSAEELSRPVDATGSRGDSVEGEQCRQWLPGREDPAESFWCPMQYNRQEDQFCCGTCTASHCCSSAKDRLDQASCFPGSLPTAPSGEGQEAGGSGHPLPGVPASVNYAALALIVAGLAGFCMWTIYVVRHCRDRLMIHNWQRAGNEERGGIEYELPAEAAVVDPPRPTLPVNPLPLSPGATDPEILTEAVATDASRPAAPLLLPPATEGSLNPSVPLSALNNLPDLPDNGQHLGSPANEGIICSVVLPVQDLCSLLEEADTAF